MVAKQNRTTGKRKAPSGNVLDQLSDLPAPKRAKLATHKTVVETVATSADGGAANGSSSTAHSPTPSEPPKGESHSLARATFDRRLSAVLQVRAPTSVLSPTHERLFDTLTKNLPSASHDTHSVPAQPRRGRNATLVYLDSDDNNPLPLQEDVCLDVLRL